MAQRQTLAFAGLGGMGSAMARRLAASGFALTVHNRDRNKAYAVAESAEGDVTVARTAADAAEAAMSAGTLVLSLSDETAAEEVVFGVLAHALRPGLLIIDTSTVSPRYAREVTGRLAERGVRRVEACVLGNTDLALAGKLRVLAGGTDADLETAAPVLDALGAEVLRLGPAGTGAAVKLAFNLLLGAQVAALAEAVQYAEQAAGLDREQLLSAIEHSGFCSRVMAFRAEIMRERRYSPAAFRAVLMDKDLRLVLDDAIAHGVGLPVTASARSRFAAQVAAGSGDQDAAAVVEHAAPPSPNGARIRTAEGTAV